MMGLASYYWRISKLGCSNLMDRFDANMLLDCYRRGVFPMAENRDDSGIFLVDPDTRGIIPLEKLHVSKSLRKTLKKNEFQVSYNHCFQTVIEECGRETLDRPETWINGGINFLYNQLHQMNHAHSVEVWKDEQLVGGLYGVSVGGAFFGESMFSRATNASKVALVSLVERLNERGFVLLDTQFITDHLKTLGAVEIMRAEFQDLLRDALKVKAQFYP